MLIQERYVNYETSKLARKCGFDEYCSYLWGIFDGYEGLHRFDNHNKSNADCWFSAPTQSHLAKWLRDMHNIQVYAKSSTVDGNGKYRDYVAYVNNFGVNDARDEEYETYEEAMEVGLLEALKRL
jgi:hypothetical protein